MSVNAGRWTVQEVGAGHWWAVDRDSGTALKLPPAEAMGLWCSNGEARSRTLAEARRLSAPTETSFVDLEFLGVRMRYWCERAGWAQEIASQYARLVPPRRRSPDMEAKLSEGVDFDRLHRSVEGPREGVRVREGAGEWGPGSANLPIIPMLQSSALSRRFCGLHAALIRTRTGGILICGEQKVGKTSAALVAEKAGLGTILTDESALIDRDGTAHGVPLPVRERSTSGRQVRALAPADPAERASAMVVNDLVVLYRTETASTWSVVEDDGKALRLLMPHMRVLDTSLGEATGRLLMLLQTARIWRGGVRGWPLLAEDLERGFEAILEHGRVIPSHTPASA